MIKRWVFGVSLLAMGALPRAAAAGAAATPGSVKWFCSTFEAKATEERFGSCSAAARQDKDVADALGRADHARQQCIELINSGVSQKRLKFNAAAAKTCVEAEHAFLGDPTRSRARHAAVRAACAGVTQGLVGSGGSCESTLDCAAPLACIGEKGGPPGKCVARLTGGSGCDEELLGGSQFYGAATGARGTCADGFHCTTEGELVCAKDLGEGQSCTGGDAAACGAFLRCVQGHCAAETLAMAGQTCAQSADCATGLRCDGGACRPKKAAGAACQDSAECKGACRSGRCAALCGSG